MSTIRNIDCTFLGKTDSSFTHTLLYENSSFDINTNSLILNDFVLSTKRFEEAFFKEKMNVFFSVCF